MTTEQGLLEAVQNLTSVVRALEATIREEYPKRKEVERRFATKRENRDRYTTFILLLIIGMTSSFLVTTSTLSYCFLGGGDHGKEICKIMPGYQASADSSDQIVEEFRRLQRVTEQNTKKIARLEKR